MSQLNLTVRVHPVVLFQIVDAYERRKPDSIRVIGTLLGNVDKGIVEVTNCFCVPHRETDDQVDAEISYASEMNELNRRVNPNEDIVGWWASGHEVTNHSSVIHEFYAFELKNKNINPIHVTLDTSLQGGRMGLKAYICVKMGVPNGTSGSIFTPIKVETTFYEPEIVGLKLGMKTIGVQPLNRPNQVEPMMDLAQVAESSDKLLGLLEQVLQYVEDVLNEKQQPDNAVGRALLDLIHSVPNMTHDQFAEMFNSNVKDLLMVVTLSQLIKTQLQLNERLTSLSST